MSRTELHIGKLIEVKPNERKQELEKLKREYKKLSADKMIINNVETVTAPHHGAGDE